MTNIIHSVNLGIKLTVVMEYENLLNFEINYFSIRFNYHSPVVFNPVIILRAQHQRSLGSSASTTRTIGCCSVLVVL